MAPQAELGNALTSDTVDALRRGLGDALVAVVLFGSRARGDARPESDWDLLVIAEGLPASAFDRHRFVRQLLPADRAGSISILARTPEEFERRLPSLYLDIALDGKILCDPRGYAAGKLAAIRRLIEEAGLYRLRTPAGDVWRWKEQPAHPWTLEWPGNPRP
jgi:predicted nucleotidyltransferase